MSLANDISVPIRHPDRFFIGGQWVTPSSDATIDVIDSGTEEVYFTVAEAQAADIAGPSAAAREAFDNGPWPRLTHAERAGYLRALGGRGRQAGRRHRPDVAARVRRDRRRRERRRVRGQAHASTTTPVSRTRSSGRSRPARARRLRAAMSEPVGVVGAIIPWNAPMGLISMKLAPALIAGCTVILKSSPEAPGEGYLFAEAAEAVGLPPGVLNVVTADREVSELLVRDPRVDKITFTGSTAAGRKIASICGERIARCTLELGGKSAAVILDDADLETAARSLARPSACCPARSAPR